MKVYIFSILMLVSFSFIRAQDNLKGVVLEESNQPLYGVSVYWQGTDIGVSTATDGTFSIPYRKEYKSLVFSFVGFQTDTITVENTSPIRHVLKEINVLEEVSLDVKKSATQRSFLKSQNLVTINSDELLKAACCNLSESFETNPSIDVNFSDALTGTKQIQMLGLTSPYILITEENIPSIRGASQAYGLTFTPGTWVNSIQITKGAGSVVNGFESISGQINTELVKPFSDKRVFVNAFGSLGGRLELNTHFNTKVSDKWSTGLYVHADNRNRRFDNNQDGFLDNPLTNQFNIMNRWQYTNPEKGWVSFFNIRVLNDEKRSGQISFNEAVDQGTTNAWGSKIHTQRLDASTKVGYVFPDLPFQSFGFQMAYSNHNQDAYFGIRDYNIEHQSAYGSFLFNSIIGDTRHKFKTGINVMYDTYDELVGMSLEEAESYQRKENSIGGFFEYSYDNGDNINMTAGVRLDSHNLLGTFFTPRLHLRYTAWEKGVFRVSAGRGKRSANIFAENQQLFASSRTIRVENSGGNIYGLDPETAWNYGFSFMQGYRLFGKKGDITLDFYQTNFQNQVVVDWENPQEISFYNLDGESIANSFQIEVNQNIISNLDIRLAYKVFDVSKDYKLGNLANPLQAEERFFTNISYETETKENGAKWKFDTTFNWLGEQRLPSTQSNPEIYRLQNYAPSYSLLNAQITKVFSKKFEVYLGAENLTDFRQKNPILGSDDPFGAYFDSTIVYAPIFGRNFYTGLRFKLD